MARMIPPQYDQSTASAAEKRVFHLLETDPDTSHWFVLHSLGLSRRPTGPYGEIDFVVLVPSGAVICLEIKGGRISCKSGIWQTVDRFGVATEMRKSPFMQARDGMFALKEAIRQRFGVDSDASHCLFAYAVIFPDVDSPPKTPEFEIWESIGRSDLQGAISKIVLRLIAAQRKKIGGVRSIAAPESAVRDIRQFLRPDFERVMARPTVVSQCESALVSLTEDQYSVLDMISHNSKCLIEGAAGTGKTLLALEYSRRQASIGRSVLLLCFNRLLGDWFESCAQNLKLPTLRVSSYFRFLRELVMASEYRGEFESVAQNASQDNLFSELLPFYGQLSAEVLDFQFDLIVLDEAQDLLCKQFLELLAVLLKGGIAGGSWYFFGDFTRQCLFKGYSRDAHLKMLSSSCQHFTHTQLKTNCRNTRRIGEETALLSGFSSPPYKLGQIDGLAVDYRYWTTPDQQLEKLTELVEQMLNEGIKLEDIVLLSDRRLADSVASRLSYPNKKYGRVSAREIKKGTPASKGGALLGFATIQSFKGMESSVVVFCDIEQVETDEPQALLYTGMSRARSLLVMLVHEGVRNAVAKSVMRKLTEEWKS